MRYFSIAFFRRPSTLHLFALSREHPNHYLPRKQNTQLQKENNSTDLLMAMKTVSAMNATKQ